MSSGLGIDVLGLSTPLKKLSGGQRSKVILAKLLLENPDVLILDEPTNHLDDQHIQWLTQFLQSFEGAYIVISHDQEFLDKITTHIADIEFGKITKYTGHLKQALRQKNKTVKVIYANFMPNKSTSKKPKLISENIKLVLALPWQKSPKTIR